MEDSVDNSITYKADALEDKPKGLNDDTFRNVRDYTWVMSAF